MVRRRVAIISTCSPLWDTEHPNAENVWTSAGSGTACWPVRPAAGWPAPTIPRAATPAPTIRKPTTRSSPPWSRDRPGDGATYTSGWCERDKMTFSEQPVKDRQDYDGASPFPGAEEHLPAGGA